MAAGLAMANAVAFGFAGFFGTLAGAPAGACVFFVADVLADFLAAFFVAGFFKVFFAAFLAGLAFLTTRLAFLARFFAAAAFAVRTRGDLRTFFAFLREVFFLGVATTNSFMAQPEFSGLIVGGALPRCFREQPEHREDQRFPLEIIFCGFARGAIDLFPHLRQPCKAGQVRVGVGAAETLADPAVDTVHKGRKRHAVAAAQRVAEDRESL